MIRMRAQPVRRQRFRYGIDGPRFLKNSRGRPMSINVCPSLQQNILSSITSLLVTTWFDWMLNKTTAVILDSSHISNNTK